ncbi:hypothetical protein [Streptosporangium sp. NPDC002721]|uniref:hypothetical protein n=1 Tax=Streptosporangium sp. NPDC002721 TaxID=3366188 RepID=UPI003693B229
MGLQGETGLQGPPGATICCTDRWGVIGRESDGGPSAVYRIGPYERDPASSSSATEPPPYGVGSLGIIVGDSPDRITFGNETDFAELSISDLTILRYWAFAGTNSPAEVSVPGLSIEIDPNVGSANYATLIYLPDSSTAPSAPGSQLPNTWQQYDASAAGSQWYATGVTGSLINCTLASPCSFDELKAALPDAVITLSLGFSMDTAFIGAIDGLQVNNTVYDFGPLGTRKLAVTP